MLLAIGVSFGAAFWFHYENMSMQYAAISKSGKNDNF